MIPGGQDIRVFVVKSLRLRSATIGAFEEFYGTSSTTTAFVSRGDVVLEGEIVVHAGAAECLGGNGLSTTQASFVKVSGGGGGGHGTAEASGGKVTTIAQGQDMSGGQAGAIDGSQAVIPLRGGCGGGLAANAPVVAPWNGGGALQISSRTRIDVRETVDVSGKPGVFLIDAGDDTYFGGGGAGGGILLEAPTVELGAVARLLAPGGSGGGCLTPISNAACSAGGSGASTTVAAMSGVTIENGNSHVAAGGGGGGLGRIRINTADGSYTKASTAVEEGDLTTGILETR